LNALEGWRAAAGAVELADAGAAPIADKAPLRAPPKSSPSRSGMAEAPKNPAGWRGRWLAAAVGRRPGALGGLPAALRRLLGRGF